MKEYVESIRSYIESKGKNKLDIPEIN